MIGSAFIRKIIRRLSPNGFLIGDSYEDGFVDGRQGKKKAFSTVWVVIAVLLVVFSLASAVYTVNEAEQAIVTTFDKVTSIESAGLHFKLPSPIQKVTKVEVNKTQKLIIGYSSQDGSEGLSGLVAERGESKMITGDFNIVNIDFFIEWKIFDPVKFIYSADSPVKVLKMIAQSSARSIIGSKNVDGVLTTEKPIIQTEIKDKMLVKLLNYDLGIQIIDVKIQDSEPPTELVIAAFKNVETAKQEKETRINEALEYKNKTLPAAQSEADKLIRDAEGYRESKINQANGDVARFNAMYTEYIKNKEITETRLYLETLESVLAGMTVYVDSSADGVQKILPLKSFLGEVE